MAASTGFPTPEKSLETQQHAEAGLQADPDNARLLGLLAAWLTSDVLNGWNGAGNAQVERAEAAARKAISLDRNVPMAHHALGWVHRLRGEHQAALDAFKEAIKIDPNFASAYGQAANEMLFLGDAKGAVAMADKAAELSPRDPSYAISLWVKGRALFALGDYEKAAATLQESIDLRPNLWFTHAWLVAALALCDRDADAKRAFDGFKKVPGARSDLASITKYYTETRFQNSAAQAAVAQLLNGLQRAGVN